jgi:hypothetical protein
VPELPPVRSAFDRAHDAAAAIRAHRIAALTPEERQHYAALEREEKAEQEKRDKIRTDTLEERVKKEYLEERARRRPPEPAPQGAVRSTDAAAWKRAEETVRRRDINERNAEMKATRARLDNYLADRERQRNERER